MGQWHEPNDTYLLRILDEIDGRGVIEPGRFIAALERSDLIVRKAYCVPDVDELFGLMRQLQYHLRRGAVGCRWVMCRETVDALARKYKQERTVHPPTFNAEFWTNTDLPTAALELEVTTIIESRCYWSRQDKLFGVPIRIDPAARSPLFEIDTPATTRGERFHD